MPKKREASGESASEEGVAGQGGSCYRSIGTAVGVSTATHSHSLESSSISMRLEAWQHIRAEAITYSTR
jgi:hypothetical protein